MSDQIQDTFCEAHNFPPGIRPEDTCRNCGRARADVKLASWKAFQKRNDGTQATDDATREAVVRVINMATVLDYGRAIPAGDYFYALTLAALNRADEVTIRHA